MRYFFFACANKSNQKKTHPAFALFALSAKSSFNQQNFSTRHPCRGEKRRISLCVALTGVFRWFHRYRREPQKQKQAWLHYL